MAGTSLGIAGASGKWASASKKQVAESLLLRNLLNVTDRENLSVAETLDFESDSECPAGSSEI